MKPIYIMLDFAWCKLILYSWMCTLTEKSVNWQGILDFRVKCIWGRFLEYSNWTCCTRYATCGVCPRDISVWRSREVFVFGSGSQSGSKFEKILKRGNGIKLNLINYQLSFVWIQIWILWNDMDPWDPDPPHWLIFCTVHTPQCTLYTLYSALGTDNFHG